MSNEPAPPLTPALPIQSIATTFCLMMLGLMVSLPLVVPLHTLPIPSFYSEWLAMLLGCLAWFGLMLGRDHRRWAAPVVVVAPLALIGVVLMQWALGLLAYGATAFTIGMMLLWAALLMVLGRTLTQALGEQTLVTRLAWFVLVGGGMNALAGLMQFMGWAPAVGELITPPLDLSVFGIYGNLAQENHFANHMALALVSAMYLFHVRQLTWRWFVPLGGVGLMALALSGSRSGFLYLAWMVMLVWRSVQHASDPADRPRQLKALVAAVFVLLLTGLMSWGLFPSSPQLQRLLTLSTAVGPRVSLWQHAIRMFADHPVLGVGFDGFAYSLIGQLHPSTDPIVWGIDQYAHNLVLQLLAVSGLSGMLAVVVPGVALLRRLWLAPHGAERLWRAGVLGVLLIHSMLEQPLFYAYFLGLAALVMGISDPRAWMLRMGRLTRWAGRAACVGALMLLFKTAHDFSLIEQWYANGNGAAADSAGVETKAIQRGAPFSVFAPLTELMAPQLFMPANAPARDKLVFNDRVRRYAPVAEVEFRHAALLAEDGRVAEAKKQFARAAFAYPHEADLYLLRFNALAAADSVTYGELAAYANVWMHRRNQSDQEP